MYYVATLMRYEVTFSMLVQLYRGANILLEYNFVPNIFVPHTKSTFVDSELVLDFV